MKTSARILADSIHAGHRVTTMACTFHRFVLAEFNTHRVFSRNSASSRAIPVEKMLQRAVESPAWPLAWLGEQPGMQGGAELKGRALSDARSLFFDLVDYTTERIEKYLDAHPDKATRLHKSLLNRPMEWFSWHTVVVTSVEWENFFKQRRHWKAQTEIRVLADLMHEAYEASTPVELAVGEWHKPLIQPDEEWMSDQLLLPLSAARCARVSYLTHDGRRDHNEDYRLFYDNLLEGINDPDEPEHWSPLEHVCTPVPPEGNDGQPIAGNLGTSAGSIWAQLRHFDPLDVTAPANDPRKNAP